MKYIDEYRNRKLVTEIAEKINKISRKEVRLMEVCGGHTLAIHRFGIPGLLPPTIRLLSGPGCPVCVSDQKFIDHAVALSRMKDIIIVTFGDLLRVPGSSSSLEKEKSAGADIRVIFSVFDALEIAKKNPDKRIIFLGIGFETTAPTTAVAVQKAYSEKLENYFVLSSHKVMPPVMRALIDEGVQIDGYIAPGHVSTITGTSIYNFIPEKYRIPVVISGFEPLDVMQSIYLLVKQIETDTPKVEVQYKRAVKPEGNIKALKILDEIFEYRNDWWRGFGIIPASGLKLKEKYKKFDAEKMIPVTVEPTVEAKGCICDKVLKGLKTPQQCGLFGKQCKPASPVGACMVSGEGACATFYKYEKY